MILCNVEVEGLLGSTNYIRICFRDSCVIFRFPWIVVLFLVVILVFSNDYIYFLAFQQYEVLVA